MDLPEVPAPDTEARRAAVARHADLAVPTGALGRLAELGALNAALARVCDEVVLLVAGLPLHLKGTGAG